MSKKIKTIMIGAICTVLVFSQTISASEASPFNLDEMIEQSAKSLKDFSNTSDGELLENKLDFPAGTSACDWIAMVLAFSGEMEAYDIYLDNLEAYVSQQYEANGYLEQIKATEYHRIALTMLALGGDPSNVKTTIGTVNLIADGTYNFHGDTPGMQGSNGLIYALLTLDSMDYEIPENAKFTREDILTQLLDCQSSDGGFALSGNSEGNIDITAMAIQAMAPYSQQEEVAKSVDRALDWLAGQMTPNGNFEYHGEENAESTAQVILALCAMGMDPETEKRFNSQENSLMDGLSYFRMNDGLYKHMLTDGQADGIATYQSLLALEAVQRMRTEESWIFDFTDYQGPEASDSGLPYKTIATVLIAAAVAAGIIVRKKHNH